MYAIETSQKTEGRYLSEQSQSLVRCIKAPLSLHTHRVVLKDSDERRASECAVWALYLIAWAAQGWHYW